MRIILSFIAAFLFVTANAQGDTSTIVFKTKTHSFGNIKQGKPVTTEFTFTNKNDKAIIIQNAEADCGCTKPDFPKTPIQKNKTGIIKVTYNAESVGSFNKAVRVTFANMKLPVTLTIAGVVTP